MRRWVALLASAVVIAVTAPVATAKIPSPAPTMKPDRLETVVSLGGTEDDFEGPAYGPDVPLAHVAFRWGQLSAEDCSYSLEQTMYWVIDDGKGDVLHGQLVGASGGTYNGSPTIELVLKATDGTGYFSGWDGWGYLRSVQDPTGCGWNFNGLLTVNRS